MEIKCEISLYKECVLCSKSNGFLSLQIPNIFARLYSGSDHHKDHVRLRMLPLLIHLIARISVLTISLEELEKVLY